MLASHGRDYGGLRRLHHRPFAQVSILHPCHADCQPLPELRQVAQTPASSPTCRGVWSTVDNRPSAGYIMASIEPPRETATQRSHACLFSSIADSCFTGPARRGRGHAGAGKAAAAAHVRDIKTISQDPHYHGWPTVVRRRSGELLVSCSGGREQHVCPFGKVELIRSTDDGQTWSEPRVLLDLGIDNRDSGILETAKAALLVTTFTSLAYEPMLRKAETIAPVSPALGPLRGWPAGSRPSAGFSPAIATNLSVWMIRSIDGGRTWSGPQRFPGQQPARTSPAFRWPAALCGRRFVAPRRGGGRLANRPTTARVGNGWPQFPFARAIADTSTTNCMPSRFSMAG